MHLHSNGMLPVPKLTFLLSNALAVGPDALTECVKGLTASRRIGAFVGSLGAADILAGILCTDSQSGTGAADLPFAGAILKRGTETVQIGPEHPGYAPLNMSFREALGALIVGSACGERPPFSVQRISVEGDGEALRACIVMDPPIPLPTGSLACHFGYREIPELLSLAPAHRTALVCRLEVSGDIVDLLARQFSASSQLEVA